MTRRHTGYFDLQLNGYHGVDFNVDGLSAAGMHRVCTALRDAGVSGILATVVTDAVPAMCRRLSRIVQLREEDELVRMLVAGLHIEGPFLNAGDGYRGAHPSDAIHTADTDEMQRLLEAGDGLVRLVTLAPERDAGAHVTRMLADRGLAVAAGHTDASLEQLTAAIDAGLSIFTHVGNGCPLHMHRHDNILQRALFLADRLMLSLIPDGAHLPFFVLKNIIDLAGIERCIVVSDGTAAAGLGPGTYTLGNWNLVIGEDRVARSPDGSHLIGSTMTLPEADNNLRTELGLDDDAIDTLMRTNPRRALGMEAPLP